jgi:hypothetical protein
MCGEISLRSCDRLYLCENCEFDQTIQDEIDRQHTIKAERRKRMKEESYDRVTVTHKSVRRDH